MADKKNVLWIMCDQLRFDYLSCYGHPHLHTPHIDKLAERGVRFTNAYVQSPFCGPSRMCAYTGRYCRSHGATWNFFPLRIGEPTLGDHLRPLGVRPVIIGKTHMKPDLQGMEWLGIPKDSIIGVRLSECGFDPYERDDGLHPIGKNRHGGEAYEAYLREKGYPRDAPWDSHANSAIGNEGEVLSGWLLKYSDLPADIAEEDSETPYMTRRAMEFMKNAGDEPWLCHLSFIKPHWPYIVPAPYNSMYGPEHVIPPIRSEAEKQNDHPVFNALINTRVCKTFARDDVREKVIPAYMGLIKQVDDQMGHLFKWMEENGLMENTMIVFTSDHGDYLGDHWMGEKDMFHDQSAKVPMIIYDPSSKADNTRGMVRDELVEMIDLAPTFLEYFGGDPKPHILEGQDLSPLLYSPQEPKKWRTHAISEYDYAIREAQVILQQDQADARIYMIRDKRWKMTYAEGHRPMLFDMENDPNELIDLGNAPETAEIRAGLEAALFKWARQHRNRTTVTPERLASMAGKEPPGIIIGVWDEADYQDAFGHPFDQRDKA